jgi:hypothetical protein
MIGSYQQLQEDSNVNIFSTPSFPKLLVTEGATIKLTERNLN